ncbi:MAG: hypothetical protein L6R35_003901 [Caloplaca aegaea]|nr:MAG: hypothetical protein L6R35_003901 [Caloplaca aegaea]
MNTTAYLVRHGWRGDGHALHPSGNGIKKALTVSKKTNRFGVGKKAHDVHADQWWSRAFDATLRSINGQSAVEQTAEIKPASPQLSIHAAKWSGNSGLYSNFTRGDGLEGTIGAGRDTADHGFDCHLADKKSPLDDLEACWGSQEPVLLSMALKQHGGDSPPSRSSVNIVESCSKTEPLTNAANQALTFFHDTKPQQKGWKSRKKGILFDTTLPDTTRRGSVTNSAAMTEKEDHHNIEVESASQAADEKLTGRVSGVRGKEDVGLRKKPRRWT